MSAIKLVSMLFIFVLSGCAASHPLGIPDTQWHAMNTEQRLQAQKKQAELDRAVEEQLAAEAHAREAEAVRQSAELEARRRDARYGERVQCTFSDAEAHIGGKWRNVEPVAMDLVPGMEVVLNLIEQSSRTFRYRSKAYASFDGQTLSMLPGCRQGSPQPERLHSGFGNIFRLPARYRPAHRLRAFFARASALRPGARTGHAGEA